LAPGIVEDLLEVVRDAHSSGTTVVVVEQSVDLALELATRAIFLERGRVRFDGAPEDLRGRDDLLRPVFLARGAIGGPAAAPGV
jgi:branched-chain amino acid transport system ATP-binding protein